MDWGNQLIFTISRRKKKQFYRVLNGGFNKSTIHRARPSPGISLWYENSSYKDKLMYTCVFTQPRKRAHLHSSVASVLSGQVTHVACLQCSRSMCPTACSNSCQYHTDSQSDLRRGGTSPTISDQLSNLKSIYCNLSGARLRDNHLVKSTYYIQH